MTTHHPSMGEQDLGVESSEKSFGADDVPDVDSAGKVEKEQGMMGGQDAVAGEGNAVVERKADVPPNGGYGWVCVAACATINAYVTFFFFISVCSHELHADYV